MPSKDPEAKRAYNKAYREANKEKLRAQKRAWDEANAAHVLAYARTYHHEHFEENREQARLRAHNWYEANKDRAATTQKSYAETHAEKISAYLKNYYETHKERLDEQARQRFQVYYQDPVWKEKQLARGRTYRQTHRAEGRDYLRAYRQAHPEQSSSYAAARRARKAGAPIDDLSPAQWQEIKEHYGYRCVYCGRKMQRLTRDHITPLGPEGPHTFSNIVPACGSCNSRKHIKPPPVPVQPLLLTIAPARKPRTKKD